MLTSITSAASPKVMSLWLLTLKYIMGSFTELIGNGYELKNRY